MKTEENDNEFIGMMFDKAVELAVATGRKVRAMVKDNEQLMGSNDYCEDRVNVEVKDNVVVKVLHRG